jgi:hypothetical protein
MTLEEVRSRYRAQIVAAAERRGAHNVRVFGSVARGDQRYDSDIDFLVDFEPGRSLLDLTGLWLDLETVLGCRVAPSPAVDSSRAWRPKRCVTRFDYENGRLRRLDAAGQVELISRFSRRGRAAFFRDVPVRSAALHRRALLGEACRGLSPPLREAHPEVPWPQIAAFRNVAIHGYFGIDYGYRRAGCYRLDVMRPSKRPSQLGV